MTVEHGACTARTQTTSTLFSTPLAMKNIEIAGCTMPVFSEVVCLVGCSLWHNRPMLAVEYMQTVMYTITFVRTGLFSQKLARTHAQHTHARSQLTFVLAITRDFLGVATLPTVEIDSQS